MAFAFFGSASAVITSCSSSSQNVETHVADENLELYQIKADYERGVAQFKKETDDKITSNEKWIADFKTKMANEKKSSKIESKKQIKAYEKKNNDLKKRMKEYKEEGVENWNSFKTELNHDMNELDDTWKDFRIKN